LMEEEMHAPKRAYNVSSRDWPPRDIGYPLVFSSHTFPTFPLYSGPPGLARSHVLWKSRACGRAGVYIYI
jgi:hypothetical protein